MRLGDVTSWLSSLESAAQSFVNATENKIISIIVAFRDKRGLLNFNLAKLQNNPPDVNAPQAVKDDYAATLAAAQDAKQKADWLGGVVDTFTNITGLGAIPAAVAGIPVALMLAAAVALTVTIAQVVSAISRYLAAKQIGEATAAQGGDAASAVASYYNRTAASSTIFGDLSSAIWPAAIVFGAYLLLSRKR